jgi:hypothetical protein
VEDPVLRVLWVIGGPAAVLFAGAVAFFVSRQAEPPLPEVPIAERVDAECRKIVPEVSDLASARAMNDCKIELLSRGLSEAHSERRDAAYKRVFNK